MSGMCGVSPPIRPANIPRVRDEVVMTCRMICFRRSRVATMTGRFSRSAQAKISFSTRASTSPVM
ncbi:MAG: hypothetical protein A4E73_01383 [Syntrophaceae bacterium PtaU1.Bin231]|nr:MAG: hypothetical protein A4E73_01383 [Syntrophaceae bacterium PtaU1.Bin231]